MEKSMEVSQKLKQVKLPCDAAIPALEIYIRIENQYAEETSELPCSLQLYSK
jgi:hypothetical protein